MTERLPELLVMGEGLRTRRLPGKKAKRGEETRHRLIVAKDRKSATYRSPRLPSGVLLEFAERPDGRRVLVSIAFEETDAFLAGGGASSRLLDAIPVARLEAAVNDPRTEGRPRLKLRIPKGRKYDDGFYSRVAEVYAYLSTQSRRPAQDLADHNGVPVSTVNRWVREARGREMLPPGQRGRGEGE